MLHGCRPCRPGWTRGCSMSCTKRTGRHLRTRDRTRGMKAEPSALLTCRGRASGLCSLMASRVLIPSIHQFSRLRIFPLGNTPSYQFMCVRFSSGFSLGPLQQRFVPYAALRPRILWRWSPAAARHGLLKMFPVLCHDCAQGSCIILTSKTGLT